ncbi:MAG: COX15/CtaA family protein, partial [Anaerolineales bacterium]
MPAEVAASKPRGRFVLLASAAAVSTYLLIVLGGIVRATGSGLGCPDWPLCAGGILPPVHTAALIEFSHRLAAALTSPLILFTALSAWRGRRPAAGAAIAGAG